MHKLTHDHWSVLPDLDSPRRALGSHNGGNPQRFRSYFSPHRTVIVWADRELKIADMNPLVRNEDAHIPPSVWEHRSLERE